MYRVLLYYIKHMYTIIVYDNNPLNFTNDYTHQTILDNLWFQLDNELTILY